MRSLKDRKIRLIGSINSWTTKSQPNFLSQLQQLLVLLHQSLHQNRRRCLRVHLTSVQVALSSPPCTQSTSSSPAPTLVLKSALLSETLWTAQTVQARRSLLATPSPTIHQLRLRRIMCSRKVSLCRSIRKRCLRRIMRLLVLSLPQQILISKHSHKQQQPTFSPVHSQQAPRNSLLDSSLQKMKAEQSPHLNLQQLNQNTLTTSSECQEQTLALCYLPLFLLPKSLQWPLIHSPLEEEILTKEIYSPNHHSAKLSPLQPSQTKEPEIPQPSWLISPKPATTRTSRSKSCQ